MLTLDLGEPTGVDVEADARLWLSYKHRGMTPEQGETFAMMLPDASYRERMFAQVKALLDAPDRSQVLQP